MSIVERERTSAEIVMYALYLYFLGLSFRNTSRALQPFAERSHVAVSEWVQRFDPKQVYPCKRIAAFLIDETRLQIGSTESWVWGGTRTYTQSSFGSLYFHPCMKEERQLEHVYKCTGLFVFMYNAVRAHIKFTLLTHFIGGDRR
jgi:hypothetical protein